MSSGAVDIDPLGIRFTRNQENVGSKGNSPELFGSCKSTK